MPFESQWARIPLGWRWGICLLLAVAAVVALVAFVDHNNSNGEVPVSAKKLSQENKQAEIVVGQDQAPVTVRFGSSARAEAALVAGVRRDMRRRVANGTVLGPLQRVGCVQSGGRADRLGYHCVAKAADVSYPFVAVLTPSAHLGVFCKKDYPPVPSENIPVSARCRT